MYVSSKDKTEGREKNKEIKTLIIVYNHSKNETSFFST
jgi:hypothetical protein